MGLARAAGTMLFLGGGGLLAWSMLHGGDLGGLLTDPGSLIGLPSATPPAGDTTSPAVPDTAPRGIRNNNPTNIESTGAPWLGQSGTDGPYVVFSSPLYGLRAPFRDLGNAHLLHNLSTIAQIAPVWAPAPSNNPTTWAQNVASYSGLATMLPLDFSSEAMMTRLVRGMIGAEQGGAWANYYPADLFHQAWSIRL